MSVLLLQMARAEDVEDLGSLDDVPPEAAEAEPVPPPAAGEDPSAPLAPTAAGEDPAPAPAPTCEDASETVTGLAAEDSTTLAGSSQVAA
jgi:hypothetical protein